MGITVRMKRRRWIQNVLGFWKSPESLPSFWLGQLGQKEFIYSSKKVGGGSDSQGKDQEFNIH